MKKLIFLTIIAALILPSCATIIHGSKQSITIDSDIQRSDVIIDGNYVGKTPIAVKLKRSKSHTIDVADSKVVIVSPSISGWVAGNLLFGGIPGLLIDVCTGGMYELQPQNVYVKIEK